jgi:Helix-turn-helix domain
MSIGETLAKARLDAGLTVTQVSQRTRIRETIIRRIEQDDYAPCGGDFYARGHVRSIARVVGTDPVPLIEEYDANLRAADDTDQFDALELAAQLKRSAPPKSAKPGAPDPAVVPGMAAAPEPADEAGPAGPAGLPAWPGRVAGRRRTNWTAVLALALLVTVGVLGYHLASSGQRQTASPAAEARPTHHPAAHHHAAHPKPTVAHTTTPTTPAAPPVTTLTPVSVTAFGPGGAAQGDNPQLVSLSASGNLASPWKTDWYDTADFGNLQSGTGLLVDMGRPVTITSAQITLGSTPGASLQLRTGNAATLAGLQPAATTTDAGGAVQLRLSGSAPSRYLLIWFTKLPPDSSGTFQAVVSAIKLQGESSAT